MSVSGVAEFRKGLCSAPYYWNIVSVAFCRDETLLLNVKTYEAIMRCHLKGDRPADQGEATVVLVQEPRTLQ